MKRACAPVALFVYNRPEHTQRTVELLRKNALAQESDLIVFSDAPKTPDMRVPVQAVRDYVKTIRGFKTVTIIQREENMGLAASIVDGVTKVCADYGRIVVLEDDLLTSPYFLTFMNDALDFYAEDERVISIHGYMFPVGRELPETFFLRDPGCWGWATWKRGWELFDQDGEGHLAAVKRRRQQQAFNLDGSYDYLEMLKGQIRRKNSSWAILWYASAFLKGKLTLYPGTSLVQNAGNDGTGTHRAVVETFATDVADRPIRVRPIPILEHYDVRSWLVSYLRSIKLSTRKQRLISLARSFNLARREPP